MTKMTDLVYTDAYGTVSEKQRRAYRHNNVSPADHDALVEHYGREAHDEMTKVVGEAKYKAPGSRSFSCWLWLKDVKPGS